MVQDLAEVEPAVEGDDEPETGDDESAEIQASEHEPIIVETVDEYDSDNESDGNESDSTDDDDSDTDSSSDSDNNDFLAYFDKSDSSVEANGDHDLGQ